MTKHERLWKKTRGEWISQNPANHEGYYVCYLCRKWIPRGEITVDHIIPRSRASHLRYDFSNLAPACWECNNEKGSKVYDRPTSSNTHIDNIPWPQETIPSDQVTPYVIIRIALQDPKLQEIGRGTRFSVNVSNDHSQIRSFQAESRER